MHDQRPTDDQPSPHAEELRRAMGWDRLPRLTDEQRAEFDRAEREADEAARRYYGTSAA